jgi:hypothetical protein
MPKVLYEDVIEVEERLVPFNEKEVASGEQNIKTLANGQKVLKN